MPRSPPFVYHISSPGSPPLFRFVNHSTKNETVFLSALFSSFGIRKRWRARVWRRCRNGFFAMGFGWGCCLERWNEGFTSCRGGRRNQDTMREWDVWMDGEIHKGACQVCSENARYHITRLLFATTYSSVPPSTLPTSTIININMDHRHDGVLGASISSRLVSPRFLVFLCLVSGRVFFFPFSLSFPCCRCCVGSVLLFFVLLFPPPLFFIITSV